MSIGEAIRSIHRPENRKAMEAARRRFVYQELLMLQLALRLHHGQQDIRRTAPCIDIDSRLDGRIKALFSHEFTLETAFAGMYFRQTWRDNMGEFCYDDKNTVSDFTGEDFTRITFKPDLARLCPNDNGSSKFSKESKEAILKRCVDVAGTADIEVCVNGAQLSIQGWNE